MLAAGSVRPECRRTCGLATGVDSWFGVARYIRSFSAQPVTSPLHPSEAHSHRSTPHCDDHSTRVDALAAPTLQVANSAFARWLWHAHRDYCHRPRGVEPCARPVQLQVPLARIAEHPARDSRKSQKPTSGYGRGGPSRSQSPRWLGSKSQSKMTATLKVERLILCSMALSMIKFYLSNR